jgi:hypothetical protein
MLKKRTFHLILVVCCIIWGGCRRSVSSLEENISGLRKIVIDDGSIDSVKDISSIVKDVTIIPLKETKGNYMGSVFSLFATKDRYIAFDRMQSQKINLFDKQGNFLETVMKVGEGPDEAFQINDCWLNDKGELEVYDFGQKKIYQLDSAFKVRNIIKAKDFYIFNDMVNLPKSNNYVGFAGFNSYNQADKRKLFHIGILDTDLKLTNSAVNFDRDYQGIEFVIFKNHFVTYKDTVRFFKTYDNYIYNIQKSGARKTFKLMYKNAPLSDNFFEEVVKKHLNKFKDQSVSPNEKASYLPKASRFAGVWLENDKYVYMTSRNKDGMYFNTIFNKKDNVAEFNSQAFVDTKKFKMKFPAFEFYNNYNNSYMAVVNGGDLKKMLYPGCKFGSLISNDLTSLYIVNMELR